MKRISFFLLFVITQLHAQLPGVFSALMRQNEMKLDMPRDWKRVAPIPMKFVNYELALRNPDEKLEVRFMIRRWNTEFMSEKGWKYVLNIREEHAPEHTGPARMYIITDRLNAANGEPEITELEKPDLQENFFADWGATAVVPIGYTFGKEYKWCRIVAIGRYAACDAFVFFLGASKDAVEQLPSSLFHCLRFKPVIHSAS